MTDTPLFSVITPIYNRLDLARIAIASVSRQTETDYEFVVVDDGSSQDVREQLQTLSSEYGFTLIRQENAGPGAARNRGAQAARGEYLVFLDSDDTLYPWALKTYRQVIEQHDRPSLIGARYFPVADGNPPEILEEPLQAERYPDFLACSLGQSFLGAGHLIVRKDAFDRAEGFTNLPINCEDHDLVLRLSAAPGFIRIISPPTVAVRIHADGLTSLGRKTVAGIEYLLQQEEASHYPGGRERRKERLRILSKHVRPVSVACLNAGDSQTAWSMYRDTFLWNVRLGNWKYLVGFPLKALFGKKAD